MNKTPNEFINGDQESCMNFVLRGLIFPGNSRLRVAAMKHQIFDFLKIVLNDFDKIMIKYSLKLNNLRSHLLQNPRFGFYRLKKKGKINCTKLRKYFRIDASNFNQILVNVKIFIT